MDDQMWNTRRRIKSIIPSSPSSMQTSLKLSPSRLRWMSRIFSTYTLTIVAVAFTIAHYEIYPTLHPNTYSTIPFLHRAFSIYLLVTFLLNFYLSYVNHSFVPRPVPCLTNHNGFDWPLQTDGESGENHTTTHNNGHYPPQDPTHHQTISDPTHHHTIPDLNHHHTLSNSTHHHTPQNPTHHDTISDPIHHHTTPDFTHHHTTPNDTYCRVCQIQKPPRCHHCIICSRCVLVREHHCFVLGTCIGHHNLRYFIGTLLIITITSLYSITQLLQYIPIYYPNPLFPTSFPHFIPPITLLEVALGFKPWHFFLCVLLLYTALAAIFGGGYSFFYFLSLTLRGVTSHEHLTHQTGPARPSLLNFRDTFGQRWYLGLMVCPLLYQPLKGANGVKSV